MHAAWLILPGCASPSFGGTREDPPDAAVGSTAGPATAVADAAVSDGGPADMFALDGAAASAPGVGPSDATAASPPTRTDAQGSTQSDPTLDASSAAGSSSSAVDLVDAAAVMAPVLAPPAWAAPLAGRYALQSFSFSEDRSVMIRWLELSQIDINWHDDHYEALLTLCSQTAEAQNNIGSGGQSATAKLPARRYSVSLANETFTITPIDVAVGYDPVQPASCAGQLGKSVAKRADQTWISGPTCKCSADAHPSADDCRVADPDSDNLPGYSLVSRTVAGTTTIWGVDDIRSAYVQGHVSAEGSHTALYQISELPVGFGCQGPVCPSPTSNTSIDCATEQTRVQFASLDRLIAPAAGWSCAAILERSGTIFPGAPLAFPARCTP